MRVINFSKPRLVALKLTARHCDREPWRSGKQSRGNRLLDCFVAARLAKTACMGRLFACQEFWAAKRRCEKADLVRLKEFHEKHFGTVSGPETHMLSALISWILSPLSVAIFVQERIP
jgi:hypothetical protein